MGMTEYIAGSSPQKRVRIEHGCNGVASEQIEASLKIQHCPSGSGHVDKFRPNMFCSYIQITFLKVDLEVKPIPASFSSFRYGKGCLQIVRISPLSFEIIFLKNS